MRSICLTSFADEQRDRGNHPPESLVCELRENLGKGFEERFYRFQDKTIFEVIQKAAESRKSAELKDFLDIVQVNDVPRLVEVLNEEFVKMLRKILFDETLVNEQISNGPIFRKIGPIEDNKIEESVSNISELPFQEIKNLKKKHCPNKRVRIFLTADDSGEKGH